MTWSLEFILSPPSGHIINLVVTSRQVASSVFAATTAHLRPLSPSLPKPLTISLIVRPCWVSTFMWVVSTSDRVLSLSWSPPCPHPRMAAQTWMAPLSRKPSLTPQHEVEYKEHPELIRRAAFISYHTLSIADCSCHPLGLQLLTKGGAESTRKFFLILFSPASLIQKILTVA